MRFVSLLLALPALTLPVVARAEPLPGTKPLTAEGDLAAQMVAGIDKYLMRKLDAAGRRGPEKEWVKLDQAKAAEFLKAPEPKRNQLKKILGVVDVRLPIEDLEYVSTTRHPSLVAEAEQYKVYAVRWPVLDGVDGEGLLLEPKGKAKASIVALPDADWTPEMLVGLAPGVPAESQFARRLAESGCRVVVPVLIDRKDTWSGNPMLGRLTNQPHREFIYRMAYQMGRHIIGYEIQKVLNLVSWFARDLDHPPVGVIGYGEGGLIALYSGALEPRIQVTVVSGYPFDLRHKGWEEPIYRNVWSLLPAFRDEQLRYLFLNRGGLFYEHSLPPKVDGPPTPRDGHRGAAPGRITAPEEVLSQLHKIEPPGVVMQATVGGPEFRYDWRVMTPPNGEVGYAHVLNTFLINLRAGKLADLGPAPTDLRKDFVPGPRQKRQFDQLVAFTQKLMRDSEARRAETFWAKLDTSSLERYKASCESFRKQLWEEVIGKLPEPTEPMNPRSRQLYDEPKWRGYEVTLDLYPDVFAYGILLLPKDLKPGEKRPVVVCQHGLEGRPTDVCNPREKSRYYNSFGAQLADKGYIVFAPQNPYIGQDKFRVLQRKANPLGLSLFSFIIRQHERILDWLAALPHVDAEKMAFYGLSYGGKTAMRVPAILPRYCLSICSGDFNEWTWKNVSVDFRGSYMFTGEYEMPEFNLGSTMVYAEMAALIAPRPFMVERGHDDGVGIDEWVAYEYAKVRRHYSRLKIPERTAIEFFSGGHEIHGQGTFAFLQKHLGYPTPTKNGE